MRFTQDLSLTKKPAVELEIDSKPVYYIGPATRDNPMSQIRTKLKGKVIFNDQKTKWNRITLHFTGKAGINIDAKTSSLPKSTYHYSHYEESTTHLETAVTLCDVEKELIYLDENVIDFGFYLPPYLPPSIETNHAFVEYSLKVVCSSSSAFTKKQKVTIPVTVCRHYLPSPNSLIPNVEYSGVKDWFEWSAEVPKAVAIEAGEIVAALFWNIEKELVNVDQIEFFIEELETYHFSTKSGIHNLPPTVTAFPSTIYYPHTSSSGHSGTHFIRTPIPIASPGTDTIPIRTHHFDPFLEISHRLKLKVHFSGSQTNIEPLVIDFPIIITDFPDNDETSEYYMDSPTLMNTSDIFQYPGDEAFSIDFELPEYTPRYEPYQSTAAQ